MSMLAARMQKMKANNLPGIERHNKRIYKNHSNEDIDDSLSYLNYDLVDREGKYKDIVKEIIDSQREGNRAVRKDAVLVNEWIITSDKTFFKDMSSEERDRFFKEATDWFKERYGQQNIAYAQVHLDETTPHMHLGVVPMHEGKLRAKNVFNRQELRNIQEELPKYLKDKGFEIERGKENSERKHLNIPEYKAARQKFTELEAVADRMADIRAIAESQVQMLNQEKKALEGEIKHNQGLNYKTQSSVELLSQKEKALEVELKHNQELNDKMQSRVELLGQKEKALEGEIKHNQELVIEYSKRSEKLAQDIPQDPVKKYTTKMPEPIYQPVVKQGLGRTIMDTKEYQKMLNSQQKNQEHHEFVAKNFNALADLYYKSETEKRKLTAELEKVNKALPIQNDYFVPAADLKEAKDEIRKKDKIIEDQKEHIGSLEKIVSKCAEFIKDKRGQAYELMNDLAQRLGLVPMIIKMINQENEQKKQQEREQKRGLKKQRDRDDFELY